MSKTNYISNKWLDVAHGVDIPQDRINKHQTMVLCSKDERFNPKNRKPYIRTTHQKTN